jgi:hypothetical protein
MPTSPATQRPIALPPLHYLSVRQPYAHAIVTGLKSIENRSWSTSFRGLVLIHAGKSCADMRERDDRIPDEWYDWPSSLSFGHIIGAVRITECIYVDGETPPEGSHHWNQLVSILDREEWVNGPWCFVLDDPILFRHPFPFTANVGIRRLADAHLTLNRADIAAMRKKYNL